FLELSWAMSVPSVSALELLRRQGLLVRDGGLQTSLGNRVVGAEDRRRITRLPVAGLLQRVLRLVVAAVRADDHSLHPADLLLETLHQQGADSHALVNGQDVPVTEKRDVAHMLETTDADERPIEKGSEPLEPPTFGVPLLRGHLGLMVLIGRQELAVPASGL